MAFIGNDESVDGSTARANIRCRRKETLVGGMSLKSYGTTNIRTTVPKGLSNVTWMVPCRGTQYPFRGSLNSLCNERSFGYF